MEYDALGVKGAGGARKTISKLKTTFQDLFINTAYAAIAVDPNFTTYTHFAVATAESVTFAAHNVSGANRIMVIGAFDYSGQQIADVTVTFNADSATRIISSQTNQANGLWRLINPDTGANNVVISHAISSAIAGWEISFTGADQTQTTPGTGSANAASGTSVSTSVTTTADNSFVIDVISVDTADEVPGLVEGQGTQFVDFEPATNGNRMAGHYILKETAGAQTMSWSWATSGSNGVRAMEILVGPDTGGKPRRIIID